MFFTPTHSEKVTRGQQLCRMPWRKLGTNILSKRDIQL